jgi:lysophospholipase L1-like esterase
MAFNFPAWQGDMVTAKSAVLERSPVVAKPPRLPLKKKLLFSLVPGALLFTLLEVGCRLGCGWDQSWVDCHRFHPVMGWCNREGWDGTWTWTGGHSHINPQGLRHDEPVGPKAPDERRLLILGDSVTFGGEVSTKDNYPSQLQHCLAAAKPQWRVLNGGVTGYDPAQESEWLEQFGCALQPDALAIGFCRNDICPSIRLKGLWSLDSRWAIGNWLLEHSIVCYKLHRHYWRWRAHVARQKGETLPEQTPDANQLIGWPLVEVSYRKIDRIAKAHNWPVVVFVFPSLELLQGKAPFDDLTQRLQALGRELGWTVIDLADAFQPQPATLFVPDDDIHPNPEGYRRAAKWIAHELLDENWLQ